MLRWFRRRRDVGASREATQAAATEQRKLHEAQALGLLVSDTAAAFRAQVTRRAGGVAGAEQ